MVDLLKRLMEANRTTGSQITTGDTRPGRTHWVAARTGKPCRRCGTPIRRPTSPATTANGSPTGAPPASRSRLRCRLFSRRACNKEGSGGVDNSPGE